MGMLLGLTPCNLSEARWARYLQDAQLTKYRITLYSQNDKSWGNAVFAFCLRAGSRPIFKAKKTIEVVPCILVLLRLVHICVTS